jgi:hypothetical protein
MTHSLPRKKAGDNLILAFNALVENESDQSLQRAIYKVRMSGYIWMPQSLPVPIVVIQCQWAGKN